MGERKGQNKYYPPDYDPKKGGLNKFRGTHALRERARKIHLGIIIIRFEMPYNIWCDSCKNHIGMGVRYNAEKTKVGMYYSTPIYKFRMKCHLCDNHFEIQTDPANLDYVILSGARRQENRWDPLQNEQVVPDTKEVQKRLFDDAMYKLEHQEMDLKAAKDAKPVLEKLVERNRTVWDDDYDANCRLRAEFRHTKREIKAQKELDDKLLAKSSLEITLLPETAQDKQMAALMKLQSRSAQEHESERRLDLLMQNILPAATTTTFGGLKRLKVLNTHLQYNDLGIKKKCTDKSMSTIKLSSVEATKQNNDLSSNKLCADEVASSNNEASNSKLCAEKVASSYNEASNSKLCADEVASPNNEASNSKLCDEEVANSAEISNKVCGTEITNSNKIIPNSVRTVEIRNTNNEVSNNYLSTDEVVNPAKSQIKSNENVNKFAETAKCNVSSATSTCSGKAILVDLPKSLALVCDYDSTNSSVESE